jgi:hypothetical protein
MVMSVENRICDVKVTLVAVFLDMNASPWIFDVAKTN